MSCSRTQHGGGRSQARVRLIIDYKTEPGLLERISDLSLKEVSGVILTGFMHPKMEWEPQKCKNYH